MVKLDWIIIISASLGIFLLILACVYGLSFFKFRTKLRQATNKQANSRRKSRQRQHKIERLEKIVKKYISLVGVSLSISLLLGGGAIYARYYQMTNMTALDTENIVSGYYLITQVDEQLAIGLNEPEETERVKANLHELGIRMASYSAKKGSRSGSKESQLLLNRYYGGMGQYGVNLSSQNIDELIENEEISTMYVEDLAKIIVTQKAVLDFYKINETSLSKKK